MYHSKTTIVLDAQYTTLMQFVVKKQNEFHGTIIICI